MKETFGRGNEGDVLDVYLSNTSTPALSAVIPLQDMDTASLQLIVDSTRTLVLGTGDKVVAGTKTFTFANGAFTADDTNGTLTITGAANGGNNSTFTISSVTNATTVVCSAATGLVDETFGANVKVVVTDTQLQGAWKIAVSNNYSNGGDAPANAGRWTDVTSQFRDADNNPIAAVTTTASSQNQYVQGDISARAMQITFTPSTGGFGRSIALVFAKSRSGTKR